MKWNPQASKITISSALLESFLLALFKHIHKTTLSSNARWIQFSFGGFFHIELLDTRRSGPNFQFPLLQQIKIHAPFPVIWNIIQFDMIEFLLNTTPI